VNDSAAIAAALDTLADLVAAKVVDRLRAGEAPGMVDQSASPLGRRRHIAAVRRLVALGEPGACQVGRRYLLSRERLDAELAAMGKPLPANDDLSALRSKYAA